MPIDPDVRRLTLSCLLLGYVGPTPPTWLAAALADGLGGLVLFGSNLGNRTDVRALTDSLREAAGRDIVLATDEEGGDVTRLDTLHGSRSPGAAALGALDDPAATEEVYAAIGVRLAEAGITTNLAPVGDVNVEPLNPVIGVRSFGSDAPTAARHVAAAVQGIQRSGTAACVKHFPGHGATRSDSHHEVATLERTREELEKLEFEPFRSAIAAGTRAVMTGHLLAPALDPDRLATVSPTVTAALREELGFRATVVTDALEMRAVSGTIGMVEGCVQALIAGADAIETGALDYPELIEQLPRAISDALAEGRLDIERLRDASRRTADLAGLGDPQAAFDAAIVAGASARCVEVTGTLPTLRAPLVIECRPPGGMASGELPWSLGERLSPLVAGSQTLAVTGAEDAALIARRAAGRSLVVVVRDPDRHRWQAGAILAASVHPEAVIVDVGWPASLGGVTPAVRTRGVAPGLLDAAARVLAGRSSR